MPPPPRPSVAVVGAGISGLLCAHQLRHLAKVTVFEWGRGPGGRTARRRATIDGKEVFFDHATPYFEARTSQFREGPLREWEARGFAAPWGSQGHWVGVPSNNAICKALAEDLVAEQLSGQEEEELHRTLYGRHVRSARFGDGQWHLVAQSRGVAEPEEYSFDALVLSDKLLVLPNQYSVLAPEDLGALALPPIQSSMTVVLLVAFSEPLNATGLAEEVTSCSDTEVLRMIVHDSSKLGRSKTPDLWVAHSTAAFAARHLDIETGTLRDETAALQELREAFLSRLSGAPPEPAFASAFPWDHAQPSTRLEGPFLLDVERRVGICGDFFTAADGAAAEGVEAAALSGLALSQAMLQILRISKLPSEL